MKIPLCNNELGVIDELLLYKYRTGALTKRIDLLSLKTNKLTIAEGIIYRVTQSVTGQYRVLQGNTEYYSIIQSNTE